MSSNSMHILLAYAFRPFFLLAGLYAALVVLAWVGFLVGGWPLPLGWFPFQWHSHEMIYGFVSAAIAGFLLTAVTNWTGAAPLAGLRLLGLVGLWLAGRLAFWFAGGLPTWLVAAVDLLFFPVLAIYLARVLLAHGNKRNLVLVAVLALLTLGNLLMHLGFVMGNTAALQSGEALGLDVIILLMVVVAGRITPAFSANWLRMNGGNPDSVTQSLRVTQLAMGSVILLLVVTLLPLPARVEAVVALAAGVINGVRLIQWAGWQTWREPLLWILHLAYAWIVVALMLRGLSGFTDGLASSVWRHVLAVGGIGTLIIGVMSRVAVGHTGRPLKLQPLGLLMYIAITLAALLRLATATQWLDYRLGITLSALAWISAFGLFVVLYTPILARPRPDGRPG